MVSTEQSRYPLSERLGSSYLQWALGKLSTEDRVDPGIAPVVIENALKFIKGAAEHPDMALTPSRTVDTGWHRLLNADRRYLVHSLREFGAIVWHEPIMSDDPDIMSSPDALSSADTFARLQDWGENPDEAVWLGENNDCEGKRCYSCTTALSKYAIDIQGELAVVRIPLETTQ